jgi:LmbE family N-acetylglucosaminyl deacetylase
MSSMLMPAASDRLLILAPHPDDESIATGGLIQVARAAGAAVRIIVLTDGDNNPWPQRWIEKRWRIDAAARVRWGARRGEEARAAMRILGLGADDARFLGLPDLGLSDLLMRNDRNVIGTLAAAIDEFRPTLLVLPALSDRHPDHSAANILSRLALQQLAFAPSRLVTFAVHGTATTGNISVTLTPAQRAVKQAAILAHETQMRLSRRRFLRYASDVEKFARASTLAEEDPHHPVRASIEQGRLRVCVDLQRWNGPLRSRTLFAALDNGTRLLQRCRWDTRKNPGMAETALECGAAVGGYVKVARAKPSWRVFDAHGWQVISRT